MIYYEIKKRPPFLLRNQRGKPRAGKILSSWPLVKPLRPRSCEEELGPSPSRRCQLLRAFIWEKRWPFCPSQQLLRMLWLFCLHELTRPGKPRRLYREKLTRLVGVGNCFFGIRDLRYSKLGIRDLKENSELKVCAGGEISKITLGITGLYKIVSGLRKIIETAVNFVQNAYILLPGSSPFSFLGIFFNFST